MKKIFILVLLLPLLAASCNPLDFGGGTRGIFRSEDGGETFSTANKIKPKGDIANLSILSLTIDPSNPSLIYASTSSGIYKSEDDGGLWQYTLSNISVSDVAIDPASSSTIYAAGIAGQNGKIVKTIDGGSSWTDIYSEPSKDNTVLSIAISPKSSSTILAGLNNGELIKSTDSGKTWQTIYDFENRVIDIKFNQSGEAYALTSRNGLYKSKTLGADWSELTSLITGDTLSAPNDFIASVSVFHDFALDRQAGTTYVGTEEGLFRTVNDGRNWTILSLPVRNSALRVSAVAIDAQNSNKIFASVNSTIYKSINGGVTWETKVLPTSAVVDSILINPQSPNIIYTGLKN